MSRTTPSQSEYQSQQPYTLGASFTANPWPQYEKMRSEGPISKAISYLGIPVWVVTDFATAKFVLSDSRFCRDVKHIAQIFERFEKKFFQGQQENDEKGLEAHMLNKDAPDHTRLRKLSMKAFTPKTISALSGRIDAVSKELINKFPIGQQFDIAQKFSYPLPITIICEILGIPEGQEREDFKRWSYILVNRIENNDPTKLLQARDAIYDTLVDIIIAKRKQLNHSKARDLLDELILARDEKDTLTDRELVSTAFLLLVAGHETTVTLINNAILRLCKDPELTHQLRNNPTIINGFIEEILRVDSPVQFSAYRYASEPLTIGNQQIAKDDLFTVSLLAANHDPHVYTNPDKISIEHKTTHMAFGHGAHFCLGAALARNEAHIAITNLVKNFSHITLAIPESELVWRPSEIVRGRDTVPVIVEH